MIRNPDIARYMKTAKRGSLRRLGTTAVALTKLILKNTIGEYVCDFSTRTEGGFFIVAEGENERIYELLLVAPDNSIDFSRFADMTVTEGLQYLAAYTNSHSVRGWEEFVEWFDGWFQDYGAMISQFTLCGHTTANVPVYNNLSHLAGVWYSWCAQAAGNAGCATVALADYPGGDDECYRLPLTVETTNGYVIQMEIGMTI